MIQYHIVRNFQDKKSARNILYSRPVLLFIFILLVLFAWGVIRFLGKLGETAKNRNNALIKVAELRETKDSLSADIASLQTEAGLEENIREKFGLAKEGEGLIVVVDDKNAPSSEDSREGNWFSKLLGNWFR